MLAPGPLRYPEDSTRVRHRRTALPGTTALLYSYAVTFAKWLGGGDSPWPGRRKPCRASGGHRMTHASTSVPITTDRAAVSPPRWAVLGVLFGVLSAAAIALYGPIGVSGTYPRFIGAILRRLTPDYATSNPYLVKMGSLITPETMLVVGLLIGGFLAARLAGTWRSTPTAEVVHARE